MNHKLLADQISRFPETPGVYIMKDASGAIIYIGKAVNLKARVRSYFSDSNDGRAQIPIMMRQLDSVELVTTDTEIEALILEADLVRRHLPKYNVELRDDKRYPYLKLTMKEPFPRLLVVRRADERDGSKYFGPYTDVTLMRQAADFARRAFMVRTCAKTLPLKRSVRPCINKAMGRCAGPCAIGVEGGGGDYQRAVEAYHKNINDLILFLRGRRSDLIKELETRMADAAAQLRFEDAAECRERIKLIKNMPKLRRPDLKVRDAERNARLYLSQNIEVDTSAAEREILKSLQESLNLPKLPRVIEAFDISNLGDSFTVAGMVRFADGRPDKAGYRKYKIKTVTGQNDFAMMMEAVSRRLRRLRDEGKEFPDLLLIDGGKGQLHAAMEALGDFDDPPMIVSLAKKEEILFSPSLESPLALPKDHPARKLVERIRDEVHRFAITYHRKIRGKQFTKSSLENIPGIGKVRARLLLTKFGSLKRLKEASAEEIACVQGFSEESAAALRRHLADQKPR